MPLGKLGLTYYKGLYRRKLSLLLAFGHVPDDGMGFFLKKVDLGGKGRASKFIGPRGRVIVCERKVVEVGRWD